MINRCLWPGLWFSAQFRFDCGRTTVPDLHGSHLIWSVLVEDPLPFWTSPPCHPYTYPFLPPWPPAMVEVQRVLELPRQMRQVSDRLCYPKHRKKKIKLRNETGTGVILERSLWVSLAPWVKTLSRWMQLQPSGFPMAHYSLQLWLMFLQLWWLASWRSIKDLGRDSVGFRFFFFFDRSQEH